MGRKVHPIGFRLGNYRSWDSQWYADRRFADLVIEDARIREFVRTWLKNPPGQREDRGGRRRSYSAGVSRILIRRVQDMVRINIHTSRPGVVIGRGGSNREALQKALSKAIGKRIDVDVTEITSPDLDAYLVARSVADQIERRVSFRRAMKSAAERCMRAWAEGAKIQVAGRLGGRDMARTEYEIEGRVPLQTLTADIDYGLAVARTTYGTIGVKAWVHRGDRARRASDQNRSGIGDVLPAGLER